MPEIKNIRDADVAGKRVLVRVDFNVPLDMTRGKPKILDDSRIMAALPTLNFLRENGAAKIILLSHLGRPDGKVVEELRMKPVAEKLAELVDTSTIELRENIRFDPREEHNDPAFAQELASLGDVYVNEAFSDSHRMHASIVGVPALLPHYAGLQFEEELKHLYPALTPPAGSIAVIGGAKFETKEPLLAKLVGVYDRVLIGGALANDVLKARGMPIGVSVVSERGIPVALAESEKLFVPSDAVVREAGKNAEREALVNDIRATEQVVDVGPKTIAGWQEEIARAPFVLWNGPVGIYEDGYQDGTDALAEAIAIRSNSGQSPQDFHAVIGGGDTLAAFQKSDLKKSDRIFLSTGGGAMLQFLADGTLPGIEVLKNSKG